MKTMKITRFTLCLAIFLALSSCRRFDIDEILLQRNDISLTLKGEDQVVYDPVSFQLAHNSRTNEFRVYDDRLSSWFIVRCSDNPTYEGQQLTADVSWTASSSTRSEKGLEFTVEKTDGYGNIWLWCKSKSIGIVIKNL